jgi:hypothetical protein
MATTAPSGSNDGGVADSLHQFNTTSVKTNGGNNDWELFFGPSNGPINSTPYDKYKYTTYDLPEAYVGKNYYLRDTIEGLIEGDTSQHTWYTSPACLPYQQTDQIHLSWNVWQFNRTLAGQVPHQGISRLITSSKRSYKDHTVRHGLAFYLEHGFMNTPEGRQQYQRNLLGIRQCVQETNNYDVLATLLTCDRYDKEYQLKHGDFNKPTAQIMSREVAEWACVQKSGYGLDWLVEEYKEHLMRNGGVTPTSFVIPPRMALYMTMGDPVKTQYMYAGENGVSMIKQGPDALTTFRGINVYKTHAFDAYEGELPIDLLSRDMQIGEFYTMSDQAISHKGKKYSGDMRDIIVYDEVLDDWKRVSFAEAIDKCSRFVSTSAISSEGDLDVIGRDDVFTVDSEPGTNVSVYGQIRSEYLPFNELKKLGESGDYKNFEQKYGKALSEGMMLVNKWSALKDPPQFKSALSVDINGTLKDETSIPTNYAGCCNWVMLKHIAEFGTDDDIRDTIIELIDAVKALYQIVKEAFPSSYVLNASEYGSEFLTRFLNSEMEKNLCTFFENCIGQHYQPYWGRVASSSRQNINIIDADVPSTKKSSKANPTKIIDFIANTLSLQKSYVENVLELMVENQTLSSPDLNVSIPDKVTLDNILRLVADFKDSEIPVDQPVSQTNDFITPYSCTPAVGDIDLGASGLLYPDPRMGGYGTLGSTRDEKFVTLSIQSHAPSHLEKMGVMQRHMTTTENVGSKKRTMVTDDWGESAKRLRKQDAVQEYLEDVMGQKEIGAQAEFRTRTGTDVFKRLIQGGALHRHIDSVMKYVSNTVQRAHIVAFLFTTVNKKSLLDMHRQDIHVPFAVLLVRPYMTYSMSSAILMKGGYDTGACYVGHSDFQLGDDVASKVHYGNFTYYSKSIVHEPKNVIVMENVMVNRYLYGNGTEFWNEDENVSDLHADMPGVKAKGLISMIVPAHSSIVTSNPISLTGSFARDNVPNSFRHYIGAEWYSAKWRFKDSTDVDDNELIKYDQTHREANSVCFRGHQFSYSQVTGGFTNITRNSGHFGEDVYPGCGRVRSGAGKIFEKQNYISAPS